MCAQEHGNSFKLLHVPIASEHDILQLCEYAFLCLFFQHQFFGLSAATHTGPRVGQGSAAEAVEAVPSDSMTSRAAAKTSDKFVGSLQKRVSGSASKADAVGSGTVLRRLPMKNERLGSVTQRAS